MSTEKACDCGHLWEHHKGGQCAVIVSVTGGRCGCRKTKSPSWFAGLIARVTRKFGATKHELDQWQDAIDQIRKNK